MGKEIGFVMVLATGIAFTALLIVDPGAALVFLAIAGSGLVVVAVNGQEARNRRLRDHGLQRPRTLQWRASRTVPRRSSASRPRSPRTARRYGERRHNEQRHGDRRAANRRVIHDRRVLHDRRTSQRVQERQVDLSL